MHVAEGLARAGNRRIRFYQRHLGSEVISETGVSYRPLAALTSERPSHVVIIRDMRLVQPMWRTFREARLFLVLDDLAQYCNIEAYQPDIPHKIICKSKWHREHIYKALKSRHLKPDVVYAYNPTIAMPDPGESSVLKRNRDKLLYASSPHKGLERAIGIFMQLREQIPTLELHVANPGYLSVPEQHFDGVHFLGTLPYRTLREHMATSLCLFHPNDSYPETFGCVFAEANMAGTPVLTHKLGAAKEVLLATKEQRKANAVINTGDINAVLSAIHRWRAGDGTKVSCPVQFTEESVIQRWKGVLGV